MKDQSEVGNVIFSVTLEYAQYLSRAGATSNSIVSDSTDMFVSYYSQSMEELRASLQGILHALGLPTHLSEIEDWRDRYFNLRTPQASKYTNSTHSKIKLDDQFFDSMEHLRDKKYRWCSHVVVRPPGLDKPVPSCSRCRLPRCIRCLAWLSSCLVFSDWMSS